MSASDTGTTTDSVRSQRVRPRNPVQAGQLKPSSDAVTASAATAIAAATSMRRPPTDIGPAYSSSPTTSNLPAMGNGEPKASRGTPVRALKPVTNFVQSNFNREFPPLLGTFTSSVA